MYCKNCGIEIPDASAFCPQCGTAQNGSSADVSGQTAALPETGVAASGSPAPSGQGPVPATPPATATPAISQPAESAAESPSKKKPRRKAAVIASVVAAVVVVAGVGIGLWWKADQDAKAAAQAEWERAHTSLVTLIQAETPNFDDSSTAIPVQITGTDLDGAAVNEVQYLHPNAMSITTLQGSYNLTFPGGYFTGAGQVVKAPNSSQQIEVAIAEDEPEADQTGKSGASSESSESTDASKSTESGKADVKPKDVVLEPVVYAEVPALEVTDELIQDIAKWAGEDPDDNGKSEQLRQVATTVHAEAVAAEEARKAAEAEAARVEARKAQITDWARAWLIGMYDNYDADTRTSRSFDSNSTFAPNADRPNGMGWYRNDLISINSITAVDENTVSYSLDYYFYGPTNSDKRDLKTATGTLTYNDAGLITSWKPQHV